MVAGHEMYSFLDGFSGYNQIRMAEEDQEKTAFVTEWGVFVAVVMMFGLKTAPTTFQRIIMEIFEEYIPRFMQHVEMCSWTTLLCSEPVRRTCNMSRCVWINVGKHD
jgi:hypothetical protein